MKKGCNNHVSVYVKSGKRAATSYYRFYQYLDKCGVPVRYRKMLSDRVYSKVMPISRQPFVVKCIVFLYIYVRVLLQLLQDCCVCRPDVLIVSRRFINRALPSSYKFLLKRMKRRGTYVVWDFDDHIIESKEIKEKDFRWMEGFADKITVAGKENKMKVTAGNLYKVEILPSTDGDMYELVTPEITTRRMSLLNEGIVRLVWVGTSSSLRFVEGVVAEIESLGRKLKDEGKTLVFTVVCDLPLEYRAESFVLRNVIWERGTAIREMMDSHVGLMPLAETDFTKGKGGFKLIQYLSVGLPVAGSPVGINCEIVDGSVGVLPPALAEGWCAGIYSIVSDPGKWLDMSIAAKEKWEKHYSYGVNLAKWKSILERKGDAAPPGKHG